MFELEQLNLDSERNSRESSGLAVDRDCGFC